MGALAVGFLAALADLTGALAGGTGLLLTVMIVYRLYEEISKQHMMDMNPMLRKFME
jgi:preprotein translocase subunit SecY